jgi:TRAP transporter 4TM/12TM fusion protein
VTEVRLEEAPDVAASGSAALRVSRAALAAATSLTAIAWSLDLFRAVGLILYSEQFLAAMLGFGIALVFVSYPLRGGGKRTGVPWYDGLAAMAGIGAAGYVAVFYPDMVDRLIDKPTDSLIAAVILFVLCMEGLRRSAGWTLFIVVAVFVGYALLGHMGPGILRTRFIDWDKLFIYLTLDTSALLGPALQIGATVVIAFVLFGQLLLRSRGSNFFNDFAIALMGRYRGGSAKVAITASGLFGTISGIASSNIMATGVVTIPLMRRAGYPAHVAAAIEAVASTGGALMPPVMGAVAFLMAEILGISYREVCIAAAVPAILYYAALFIFSDLEAARGGYARVPAELIPRLRAVMTSGWIFALPFVVLIWALFVINALPEKAALYASAAILLVSCTVGYKGHRLKLKDIWESLIETSTSVVSVVMIVAGAGFIMGVLNLSGLGFALTMALVETGSGEVFFLLVIAAAICIVLGMGMPPVGVYVLLAVVIAPSLVEVGVRPLAAHMFIFYLGMMSMITPPVAIAAFFAANLAGTSFMRTGYTAMRLGWTAYIVPFLFVFSPSLFLDGEPIEVLHAVVTALGGVWLVSAGFVGYFIRALAMDRRVLFVLAGILLMLPANAAPWALLAELVGLALGVLLVALEISLGRRTQTA